MIFEVIMNIEKNRALLFREVKEICAGHGFTGREFQKWAKFEGMYLSAFFDWVHPNVAFFVQSYSGEKLSSIISCGLKEGEHFGVEGVIFNTSFVGVWDEMRRRALLAENNGSDLQNELAAAVIAAAMFDFLKHG